MALKRGLVIAKERLFHKLVIQTDSQPIINLLKAVDILPSAHAHIVQICKCFLNDHPEIVEIHHIYRESNACADWLANVGVNQRQQVVVWEPDGIPNHLFRLMQQDVGGVSWPRLVPFYAS
ncbi:uncharacterized protein LOC141614539 [Silene latifolia]|uniref:uncharacterized protein LOC141614539 n=1 Tax=Silene latifolia TaxID=37657 RepID=UPI003D7896D6